MKSKYVLFAGLIMFVLGIVGLMVGMDEVAEFLITAAVVTIVLILPFAWAIEMVVRRDELAEKRKARMAANEEKLAEIRTRRQEYRRRELERNRKNVIVEVKYLGMGATTQKRGGLGGAMLGGFFAGPIGAVVGAALPKNAEGKHRFAVKYGNGRVEIKELHPNSWEYKKLIKMVKWENL